MPTPYSLVLLLAPIYLIALSLPQTHATKRVLDRPLLSGRAHARSGESSPRLRRACQAAAQRLLQRLGAGQHVIVRPPLVIGGDLPKRRLDAWYRQTMLPAMTGLAHQYFRAPPDEPVVALLLSREDAFRQSAWKLFGDRNTSALGYYKPSRRTLLVNLEAGASALRHELTHALMDFDFPRAPDWLSEGLASLHEACRISTHPRALVGIPNWRTDALLEALRIGRLPSLESLITLNRLQGPNEAVRYAQARHLCMYLQHRGLLTTFYARCRLRKRHDPTGRNALIETLDGCSWPELETAFRRWLLRQAATREKSEILN